MNYNSNGGTYDTGCWQINTVHTSGGTGLPAPPGGNGTLNMPKDWNAVKDSMPNNVANFVQQCQDPVFNAAQAYSISSRGTGFGPWTTYTSKAYKEYMAEAAQAVKAFRSGNTGSGQSSGDSHGDNSPQKTQWSDTSTKDSKPKIAGKVTLAPGADRPGVQTKKKVFAFCSRIAGIYGGALVIGTGTNHSQMTTSGNVSDHWTGDAADIISAGGVSLSGTPGRINPTLTKLGQDALVAAGWSRSRANAEHGGLFTLNYPNGCRIQIIFNTEEGGDHYNHLHVGIAGNLPDSLSGGVDDGGGGAQTPQGQQVQNDQSAAATARVAAWFQLPTVDSTPRSHLVASEPSLTISRSSSGFSRCAREAVEGSVRCRMATSSRSSPTTSTTSTEPRTSSFDQSRSSIFRSRFQIETSLLTSLLQVVPSLLRSNLQDQNALDGRLGTRARLQHVHQHR
jgi:hypothetical protein